MKLKRTLFTALFLCTVILGVCLPVSAGEKTLHCEYEKITGNGYVADTFLGVDAIYNLNGRTLYCTELVQRFFRQRYGLEINCGKNGPTVLNSKEYVFEKTDTPRAGDVLYASASARGRGCAHWAICKTVDEDGITLFEQNWKWNGCAGVDREIPLEGNCYSIYRLTKK